MKAFIEEFYEQGYAILYGVLEVSCLEAVRRECEALVEALAASLLAAGKISETFDNEPFESRMIRLYEKHPDETPTIFRKELHREGFFHLFAQPRLLEIAEQILGPEIRIYPNYSVRPKLPENKRTEVLWHQDAGYTSSDADILRMMNIWTPLVAVNELNGCMQFVPGSQRQGVVPHEKDLYYLRIRDDYIKPLEVQAISIEIDPGDVVIFSNLLFHRGLPNRSSHIRWSLDFRYQDATQPTLRSTQGYLLRSKLHPAEVVKDKKQWAQLEFQ